MSKTRGVKLTCWPRGLDQEKPLIREFPTSEEAVTFGDGFLAGANAARGWRSGGAVYQIEPAPAAPGVPQVDPFVPEDWTP